LARKDEMPDPREERKAFLLRLPPDLHAELRGWAAAELRSLNGQIEFLLREALQRRKGGGDTKKPGSKSKR
jgi:hypothetical protein